MLLGISVSSPPPWAVVVTSVIAGGLFARALLFFLGYDRSWAKLYFDATKPIQARNAPFAMLPIASALASLLLTVPAQGLPQRGSATFLLLSLSGTALVIAAEWVMRPPRRLKPEWLRAAESERGGAPSGIAPMDRRIVRGAEFVGAVLAVLSGALFLASLAAGFR